MTTAHGCMPPCPTCKQGCTICHPCDPLKHGGLARGVDASKPIRPLKCDICGSTAIDHTEFQCQMNKQFLKPPAKQGDKT